MKQPILIVDDDEQIRQQLRWALDDDFEVHVAGDRTEALERFRATAPRIVILDLGLPPDPHEPTEGFSALEEIVAASSNAKVIILSGNSDHANALRAIDSGAFDFVEKPPDLEVFRVILERALRVASLEEENRSLQAALGKAPDPDLLGNSPKMQEVYTLIRKVATVDVPVLITGESGTGKEVVARAIHRASNARNGPFTVINCGAIPENLLESELFGYEKGAFTGAVSQRVGRLETAEGGTVFLDEIGELSLRLQAKILRFLQEKTIERVGGRELLPVDARVLAATNRDLAGVVARGEFREDLYFRLAVVQIALPPLRERGEDLITLARAFVHRYANEFKKNVRGLSRSAEKEIRGHSWPGNVRELENTIKRAVVMAEASPIGPEDLGLRPNARRAGDPTLKEAREALEREMVQNVIERMAGNISRAARALGISRPTLYDLLERYNIPHERGHENCG